MQKNKMVIDSQVSDSPPVPLNSVMKWGKGNRLSNLVARLKIHLVTSAAQKSSATLAEGLSCSDSFYNVGSTAQVSDGMARNSEATQNIPLIRTGLFHFLKNDVQRLIRNSTRLVRKLGPKPKSIMNRTTQGSSTSQEKVEDSTNIHLQRNYTMKSVNQRIMDPDTTEITEMSRYLLIDSQPGTQNSQTPNALGIPVIDLLRLNSGDWSRFRISGPSGNGSKSSAWLPSRQTSKNALFPSRKWFRW